MQLKPQRLKVFFAGWKPRFAYRPLFSSMRVLQLHSGALFASRVAVAIAIGIFGIWGVQQVSATNALGGTKSTLFAALPFAMQAEETEEAFIASDTFTEGEVYAARSLVLSARASGVVQDVRVVSGSTVAFGDVIVVLDTTEAERVRRDAEIALQQARVERVQLDAAPPAPDTSVARMESEAALSAAIEKSYIDSSNAYITFPYVMAGLTGMLFGYSYEDHFDYLFAHADRINATNAQAGVLKSRTLAAHEKAKQLVSVGEGLLRVTPGSAGKAEKETLLHATYDALSAVRDALARTRELHDFLSQHLSGSVESMPETFATYDEQITSYTSDINDRLDAVLYAREEVRTARAGAGSGSDTPIGVSEADRLAADLRVREAENALLDATAQLDHFVVRAPFAGLISDLRVRSGEWVNDGENVGMLLSSRMQVRLLISQADAARVAIGTRVRVKITETDIVLPAYISELDPKGRMETWGVVYDAVLSFEESDSRVKPGMRVEVYFPAATKLDTPPSVPALTS